MELLINDFSFGLFSWQLFILLGLIMAFYAMVVLAKDQKEPLIIKMIVFISFFLIPIISSVFYLIHYYYKKSLKL